MTQAEIAAAAFLMENGIDPDSLLPQFLMCLEREQTKLEDLYGQRDRAIEAASNQIKAQLAAKRGHQSGG